MADGIKVNEGLGPTIDTDELLVDGQARQRQRVQVGGTDGAEVLAVVNGHANVQDAQAHTLLTAIRDAVDEVETLLAAPIGVAVTNPTADPETGLAKEATLQAVEGAVDGLEGAVGTVADLETLNTVIGRLKRAVTVLEGTIDVSDGAAQTTLTSVLNALTGQILNKLNDIYGAVDTLEATAENISFSADVVELNTDEVEALLIQVRDKLTLIDQSVGATTDLETLSTVIGRLKRMATLLDTKTATEATLASVLAELQGTVAVAVSNLPADYPLPAGQLATLAPEVGLAKDATLQALKDEVDGLEEGLGTVADPSTAQTAIGRLKAIVEALGSTLLVDDGHPDPQTNALTNAQLRDSPVSVSDPQVADAIGNRYGGGKTPYAGVVNASGDNAVITPVAGNFIRVWWVSFVPDPDNATNPLVTVKFAGGETMYMGYAMSHWEIFDGAVDEAVVVNLSEARDVAVTIHYEEMAP